MRIYQFFTEISITKRGKLFIVGYFRGELNIRRVVVPAPTPPIKINNKISDVFGFIDVKSTLLGNPLGGSSGSPLLDERGNLVGVMRGEMISPMSQFIEMWGKFYHSLDNTPSTGIFVDAKYINHLKPCGN